MGIPLDKAELLALFLENIIYGAFLTFFILLVVISFGAKDIRFSNRRFILPVATLMMILATIHLTIDFIRAFEGFVTGNPGKPPNPIAYYQVISHPLHVTKTPVYALQTILGDSVLVWRCYIIYNRKLYILIPATIILGANLAIGIVVSWSIFVAIPGTNIFETASSWITAFFIITVSLNVCCTGAIVTMIWRARRHASIASRSLFPVVAAIIESGALYTTSVLGLLVAYLSNSNGQYTALDLVTPLVGVTYCLIILQVYFQLRMTNTLKTDTTGNWSIPQIWKRNSPDEETSSMPGSDHKSPSPPGGVVAYITERAEAHANKEPQLASARNECY